MIEAATKPDQAVKTGYDIIYLVTCSLHGIVPKKCRVEQMNLTNLYRMAKKHSLTAMVYMALESADTFSGCKDIPLVKTWKDAKEKAIRKNLLLDAERREILSYMDREGIWYLPLKGILLKGMYPQLGMRQMADNDILYDITYQNELVTFMTARGYEASQVGKGNHDIYHKPPVYNFELHTALYGASHDKNWEEYYKDVKQRLLKDEGNCCGYHFSEEDFYIYNVTHAFKHYNGNGTGLRTLVDQYVLLLNKETKLDCSYIRVELNKLQLTEFEQESRELCQKLFSKEVYPLTPEEQDTLIYYISCGTYGSIRNSVEKKLRGYQPDKKSLTIIPKVKYCLRRIFPDWDHYKNYAPFVYRHKWLIPFYLIYRAVHGPISKRKKIHQEIQALHKYGR